MSAPVARRTMRLLATLLLLAGSHSARAQEYTLGDVVQRLRLAEGIVGAARLEPTEHAMLLGLERWFRDAGLMGIGVDSLAGIYVAPRASFTTVLRWDRDGIGRPVPEHLADSLVQLNRLARGALRDSLRVTVGPDSLRTLYAPVTAFLAQILRQGMAVNTERLRRFAVKYGPGSPRLNLAEAGLNYLGQLVVPSVFLGNDAGPSPYEIVASYRSTDLTVSDGAAADGSGTTRVRLVSTGQLGLRWYNFATDCGTGSPLRRALNPCHISGGAFLMGPSDTPLTRITGAGHRGGLYAAFGGMHAGVVFGTERRFVLGLDSQVLPYLF